jgi:hypothetical protein
MDIYRLTPPLVRSGLTFKVLLYNLFRLEIARVRMYVGRTIGAWHLLHGDSPSLNVCVEFDVVNLMTLLHK